MNGACVFKRNLYKNKGEKKNALGLLEKSKLHMA
jgi:hypothetical protein